MSQQRFDTRADAAALRIPSYLLAPTLLRNACLSDGESPWYKQARRSRSLIMACRLFFGCLLWQVALCFRSRWRYLDDGAGSIYRLDQKAEVRRLVVQIRVRHGRQPRVAIGRRILGDLGGLFVFAGGVVGPHGLEH